MTASTANHLWSPEDVLGQGATASVFKGRNKKTGEVVAVKVFNMGSYSRPYEVQMREFEMLRKLNHVNIVKLFAVEEMHMNPMQKAIVMEFCSGGSLLNLLEEPENAFGLPESEFLIVLQCVVHGMNHLRENRVVHRDIKPGNIMRQVGEDGCSVYKLTDFGAARELEDDEKFVSIYGTEEYLVSQHPNVDFRVIATPASGKHHPEQATGLHSARKLTTRKAIWNQTHKQVLYHRDTLAFIPPLHPDMYERAVLKKPQQKTYGVTVDLWSIGVTFYHAATGSLPFIPYGGPRRNKQIMYKIITEKPARAIAGVQKVGNGSIEWSYQLPHHCQLSEGLKMHLVPVLANILEANQEKCWNFDQFFAATMDILQRVKVHVFSLQQAMAHVIYIHFYNTASIFFEEVQAQTGIRTEMQQYLYQGHPLVLEPGMKIINLPPTTAERPIFLLSRRAEKIAALPPSEPETPAMPSRFDVVADHTFSRTIVGVIHQYLRIARNLHKHRELILHGFYSLFENVRIECNNTGHKIAMVNMKLLSCLNTEETLEALGQFPLDIPHNPDQMQKLRQMQESLPVYVSGIREFQSKLHLLHVELGKYSEVFAQDKSLEKMSVFFGKIGAVHQQYRKDRHIGKLNYNDEQIHKFEKFNLSVHIKKVKALFRDDCLQKYQEVLAAVITWSSEVYDMQSKLDHFSGLFLQLIRDLQMCEGHQTKVLDRVLVLALQRPAAAEEVETKKNKDLMILRMKRLRDEMELVARELQSNNTIIESLGAFSSTLVMDSNISTPQGS